ncbi:hypothetical protein O3M35_002956 [Rhynocoris fuscipes]|uniref:Zinc finger CCCH-type with G patch domain-containing protein n=1 Tax=Rhynocoris fuscipes TaxID=488301 RepID=A0AAW1CIM8_9HEMI
MDDKESLADSLNLYKTQLNQITETLKVTPAGSDRDNLISLKNDIEELLKLTQDSIDSLGCPEKKENEPIKVLPDDDPFSKEYALFKAELESLHSESSSQAKSEEQQTVGVTNGVEDMNENEDDEEEEDDSSLQDDLQSLVGTKCRAPYVDKSGSVTYYNALISNVEISENISDFEQIKVRVLFINPTEKKMVPCPYFLDDKCKFNESGCNFSHGYIVAFDQLKEYIEPDFSRLKTGCRILAKVPNSSIWIPTVVEDITNSDTCIVKHERAFVEVPIHDVLPPSDDITDECMRNIEEEECNDEEVVDRDLEEFRMRQHQDTMVDMSLSREQPGQKLGQWEQFTKGIGSKLMAKMGYIVGTGLGKSGEGILQPVEAVVLPAGKSLDHCMNLKEAAGGDTNLFKLEKVQKRLAAKALARSKREYYRQKKLEKDVFFVINTSLKPAPSTSSKATSAKQLTKNLNAVSDRQLNVERFKLSESIKQSERNIKMLKRSMKCLDGHRGTDTAQKNVSAKLESHQRELMALKHCDNKLEREQIKRETKKKMTVF